LASSYLHSADFKNTYAHMLKALASCHTFKKRNVPVADRYRSLSFILSGEQLRQKRTRISPLYYIYNQTLNFIKREKQNRAIIKRRYCHTKCRVCAGDTYVLHTCRFLLQQWAMQEWRCLYVHGDGNFSTQVQLQVCRRIHREELWK